MTFQEFIDQAWADHGTRPSEVASRILEALPLLTEPAQIQPFTALLVHVLGEHLARWEDGIALLNKLEALPLAEADSEARPSIARSIATLELSSGARTKLEDFGRSDQIRILATSASALSGQNQTERARELFLQAIELASSGLEKSDPANRALAVTGNNLACALEEKSSLTGKETELLLLAANTGRKFWEIAGTWLQVERAEYRLAHSYLKAGDTVEALVHAEACLEIVRENGNAPFEAFFGFEALSKVLRAQRNFPGLVIAQDGATEAYRRLCQDDQASLSKYLEKILSASPLESGSGRE